ncbi:hypothetical protein HC931_14505 [Candidatus Gracilibacteria bacterium]|nr:hypothetical protein [Candidatus Gracilibacteria bacterium]
MDTPATPAQQSSTCPLAQTTGSFSALPQSAGVIAFKSPALNLGDRADQREGDRQIQQLAPSHRREP